MNREEAANWLEHYCYGDINILRDCDDDIAEKIQTAMDEAIAALRGPQPDPITGLVPCGCGGEAMIHECHNLSHVIYCDKCKIETNYQLTADAAKDAWNAAMGYKEQ